MSRLHMNTNHCFYAIALLLLALSSCHPGVGDKYSEWKVYGGNKEANHYSSLTQVDTSNVRQLRPAWIFHTGDTDPNSQIQVNPVIADGILYGVSPKLKLFAVDAATGEKKWVYDPAAPTESETAVRSGFAVNACRGVTLYNGGNDDRRVFYTAGALLHCINAANGRPIPGFGDKGSIDLHNDLGADVKDLYITSTTPGIIYKDLLIIGTRVAEEAAAAPGHIRAYDVHSGKLRWIFHTIPYPGETGYESWEDKEAYKNIGGANAWGGFSMDEEKGIVFAPIGSAVYDFYGGRRKGDDLFANCVLALNASTGERIWHFQTVHHDVWDRDPPTAPVLVTLQKEGKTIEAVAQLTKSGFIFLLDRQTGKPIYPVEERPVPTVSELSGEQLSPTQPVPTVFPPFARQSLSEKDLNRLVPDSSFQDIKQRLAGYKTGNMFTPPSHEGTVIFPGFDGGIEWGGPSFDPSTGLLYINANEMPWILTMVDTRKEGPPASALSNLEAGKALYAASCMSCHGPNREGGDNYPSLTGVSKKYTEAQLTDLLSSGRRMMPAFKQLSPAEKGALASFVLDLKNRQAEKFINTTKPVNPYYKMPYTSTGYNKFLTKEGYPAVAPPWGSLTAINLSTGTIAWKDTLGDYPEWKAKGIHTGTENYGGSVVTAGGLLFIAATRDAKFRAFNKRTGALLWETDLPAAGFATPSVYEINGRQYIVIACGGGKLHQPSGDAYMAFALP